MTEEFKCEGYDCGEPKVEYLFHETNKSVYKVCFTCFSSRAVKKQKYEELVSGSYDKFREHRDGYFKSLYERATQRRLEEIVSQSDEEFYLSRAWLDLRFRALSEQGRYCACCGRRPPSIVLHVDHVKPRSKYPDLALDLGNLQILCAECNLGKSNKYENDFRTPDGAA